MKKTISILAFIFLVFLFHYFYTNILFPERSWVKYTTINDGICSIDIYYEQNATRKRFFQNEYQILIKDKGECTVNIYDDWGNVIGKKIEKVNSNELYYVDLENNTWRFSHSPFEKDIEGSGMGELYKEILQKILNI